VYHSRKIPDAHTTGQALTKNAESMIFRLLENYILALIEKKQASSSSSSYILFGFF